MGFNLKTLEDTFMSAYRNTVPFVAVRVRVEGVKGDEFIINPHANILSKLEYYKQAYNYNLTLKSNENIRIVSVAYGYTFDEIHRIL